MKSFSKAAFIIIVALQVAALGIMIARRMYLLDTGKKILLQCEPVDPRSLFSGDYVILNYKISRLNKNLLIDDVSNKKDKIKRNDTVYIALKRDSESNFWQASAISKKIDELKKNHDVIIQGRIVSTYRNYRIKYGVESYFVPQYEGLKIEKNLKDTSVELAVSGSGESAIRRLFIQGKEVTFY
ncbi:GDYXXLXY domain-containing protein [Spirochaetota bacterium]